MLARVRTLFPTLIVCVGLVACVGGFAANRMWAQLAWNRFAEALLLAAVSLAIAAVLRRWRDWPWANAVALTWFAALIFFSGTLAVLATLLVAAAAVALGSLLVPAGASARGVLALPVGLVLMAGGAGWLLPLPIHRRWVYLAICAATCLWRAPELRASVRDAWRGWCAAIAAAPLPAAGAMLLLGLASTGAWLPTMQADDLAYHLGLPTQLQVNAAYALDPTQQMWALAPWLGDVVQGIAQVLAGGEARGAVDALWMAAAAALLWCLTASLGGAVRVRWAAVALFASLPMLAMLVGGMQSELPATALVVALACVIARARDGGGSLLMAGSALAAGLVALKLGHAIAAAVLLAWALARARGHIDQARLPVAGLLFFALAGSSYFQAWHVSGNPLLPLFNDVFRSPLLAPVQLADPRWHAGFSLALPWSITFDTNRYLEAWPGGFGFVLVALAGAWILALFNHATRAVALAASAVLLLPLLPMQYARYAFPGLVLLLPPMLIATRRALGDGWFGRVSMALCVLNLAFAANSSWLLHVNARHRLVVSGGRVDDVFRHYAPERLLIGEVRRRDPGPSIVLALDAQTPFVAELGLRGRSVATYVPGMDAARKVAEADPGGRSWQQLIAALRARWLLVVPGRLSAAQRAGLSRSDAQRVLVAGSGELWSLGEGAQAGPGDAQ